jgi:hypothetical protein
MNKYDIMADALIINQEEKKPKPIAQVREAKIDPYEFK